MSPTTSVAAVPTSATVYCNFISVFTALNTANPSRFGGTNSVNGSILYQVFSLPRFDSVAAPTLFIMKKYSLVGYLAHS